MEQSPSVHVEFYMHAKEDKRASREAGRPVYRDVEYVRIRFPGDKNRVLEQPAHERPYLSKDNGRRVSYAEMYPRHYELFQKSAEQIVGTPVAELPILTMANRATLKAQNVHTVEQLAALDGLALKSLGMGGRAWKDQAQAYLDKAAGSAGTTKLAAENADLRERMKGLETMLAELSAKRGPGRPRKDEVAA